MIKTFRIQNYKMQLKLSLLAIDHDKAKKK